MSKANTTAWKNEQRELLRAAFAPAFTRYSEMVLKEDEPDTYRKYLEFIAKQVGLEEPTLKNGPHDGLTTVQINIGQFHQAAKPINAPPFERVHLSDADVVDATLDVGPIAQRAEPTALLTPPATMPAYDPALVALLALDVAEGNDFMDMMDTLIPT